MALTSQLLAMAVLCAWMGLFQPESFATELFFGPRGGRGEKLVYLILALVQDSAQDMWMSRYVLRKSGVQFTRFYRTPFVRPSQKRRTVHLLVRSASTPLHIPTPAVPLLTTEIKGGIREVRVDLDVSLLAGAGFGRILRPRQGGSWEARLGGSCIARPPGSIHFVSIAGVPCRLAQGCKQQPELDCARRSKIGTREEVCSLSDLARLWLCTVHHLCRLRRFCRATSVAVESSSRGRRAADLN